MPYLKLLQFFFSNKNNINVNPSSIFIEDGTNFTKLYVN